MSRTIFLAASMNFYKDLVTIGEQLEEKGWKVHLPVSAGIMKEKNDFEVSHFKGVFSYQDRKEFILTNFKHIEEGDAVLVINNEKNGIKGYIGANVLMEIGLAVYFGKKVYIFNPVTDDAPYKEELLCLDVIFINRDLEKVQP